MAITLISHQQVEILEKVVSREFSGPEIARYHTVHLIDDKSGKPIIDEETGRQSTITYDWTESYVIEAFVNVLETFLLSENIGVVCPIENGKAVIGGYWSTVLEAKDFVVFPRPVPSLDKGVFDLSFFEWLYGVDSSEDFLTWARAYNGQFDDLDDRVILRLAESDLYRLRSEINGFNEENGREERIGEDGILTSPMIFKAYRSLCDEYEVQMKGVFGNMTHVVLPPLTNAFLGRLPEKPSRGAMLETLFALRDELKPVRKKFSALKAAEDPDVSVAEAQGIANAINADAKRLAARWDSSFTDHALVQFCLENVSFVLKCVLKPHKIEGQEIVSKLLDIAPSLERYLRSSAPTELSRIALETKKLREIKRLFKTKLDLSFTD